MSARFKKIIPIVLAVVCGPLGLPIRAQSLPELRADLLAGRRVVMPVMSGPALQFKYLLRAEFDEWVRSRVARGHLTVEGAKQLVSEVHDLSVAAAALRDLSVDQGVSGAPAGGLKPGPVGYSQKTSPAFPHEVCMQRAPQALQELGLSVGHGTVYRIWVGESPTMAAYILCFQILDQEQITIFTVGGDAIGSANLIDARMWAPLTPTGAATCGNLAGRWDEPSIGNSIEQSGNKLTFHNYFGQSSPGRCIGTSQVIADSWDGGLVGDIVPGGVEIRWRNQTTWKRTSGNPDLEVAGDPALFLGAWQRNGRKTEIKMVGSQLTCINEFGASTRCAVRAPRTIQAVDWEGGLLGTLSNDNRTIQWANNSFWSR